MLLHTLTKNMEYACFIFEVYLNENSLKTIILQLISIS